MRYTTVIDISEFPDIYRNRNACRVYIHMALKSGYHDADRDVIRVSVRRLAADCGISVAASRHALGVLQRAGLVASEAGAWRVRKWVLDVKPTPRRQSNTAPAAAAQPFDADADAREIALRRHDREMLQENRRRLAAEWVAHATVDELADAARRISERGSFRTGAVIICASDAAYEVIKEKIG